MKEEAVMKTTISKCGFSAFVLCLAVVVPSAVHAAGGTKTPKPLRTSEVVDMYFDKTWKWETGGGRFIADGRKFVAATEEKGKKSIGEGRWTVDANGTLCMRATWKSAAGNALARCSTSASRAGHGTCSGTTRHALAMSSSNSSARTMSRRRSPLTTRR
jgi:hypothetical protein